MWPFNKRNDGEKYKNYDRIDIKPCDNKTCMNYEGIYMVILYHYTENKMGALWPKEYNYMPCLFCKRFNPPDLFKENPLRKMSLKQFRENELKGKK